MTSTSLSRKLDNIFRDFSKSWLAEYLDLTLDATNKWRVRDTIPYNKIKGIVEFMEMHTDDCVSLCQDLMDYYKGIQWERVEKSLERKQKRWKNLSEKKSKSNVQDAEKKS